MPVLPLPKGFGDIRPDRGRHVRAIVTGRWPICGQGTTLPFGAVSCQHLTRCPFFRLATRQDFDEPDIPAELVTQGVQTPEECEWSPSQLIFRREWARFLFPTAAAPGSAARHDRAEPCRPPTASTPVSSIVHRRVPIWQNPLCCINNGWRTTFAPSKFTQS
jgi:hypothetical protein